MSHAELRVGQASVADFVYNSVNTMADHDRSDVDVDMRPGTQLFNSPSITSLKKAKGLITTAKSN